MNDRIRLEKKRLRRELRARRRGLDDAERARANQRITEAVRGLPQWERARSVGLYHSLFEEVDTAALIEAAWATGRRVALPLAPGLGRPLSFHWVERDTPLVRSSFDALEPAPDTPRAALEDLDLVIVPGLGFDRRGARLGQGGGYYDRTLQAAVPAVLVAFACQELPEVPEDAHDRRLDLVVTEDGVVVGAS